MSIIFSEDVPAHFRQKTAGNPASLREIAHTSPFPPLQGLILHGRIRKTETWRHCQVYYKICSKDVIPMRIMAVDYGDARTGVAFSDPTGLLALSLIHI